MYLPKQRMQKTYTHKHMHLKHLHISTYNERKLGELSLLAHEELQSSSSRCFCPDHRHLLIVSRSCVFTWAAACLNLFAFAQEATFIAQQAFPGLLELSPSNFHAAAFPDAWEGTGFIVFLLALAWVTTVLTPACFQARPVDLPF